LPKPPPAREEHWLNGVAQSYLRRQFVHQLLAQVFDWLAHGSEIMVNPMANIASQKSQLVRSRSKTITVLRAFSHLER
jgi:hypothetical protein